MEDITKTVSTNRIKSWP